MTAFSSFFHALAAVEIFAHGPKRLRSSVVVANPTTQQAR